MIVVEDKGYGWIKPLSWTKPVYMQKILPIYKAKSHLPTRPSIRRIVHRTFKDIERERRERFYRMVYHKAYRPKRKRRYASLALPSNLYKAHELPGGKKLVYITLNSWGYKYSEQKFDSPILSMRLLQKFSKAPCIYGKTYGFRGNIAWVNRGCRGRFLITFAGINPREVKHSAQKHAPKRPSPEELQMIKVQQIQRLINTALQKKNIIEMEIKKGQGLTHSLKEKIDDFCNIIGKAAELEGKSKSKATSECQKKWYSLVKSYERKIKPVASKVKKVGFKPKVRKMVLPIKRWSQPAFPSWISPGITFKREVPEVVGTSIFELPKGAEIQEGGQIKRVLEKKYFGIPFKYLALGGIGLVALLSILGGSSQPKVIIAGGRYV